MGTTLQTPLLSRLRSETRTEHDAVERTLLLMEDDLTLERYRRRLEQFYGFYQPVEKWLLDDGGFIAPWLAVEPRRKTPLLQADLIALGQQTDTRLPLCTHLRLVALPSVSGVCMFLKAPRWAA